MHSPLKMTARLLALCVLAGCWGGTGSEQVGNPIPAKPLSASSGAALAPTPLVAMVEETETIFERVEDYGQFPDLRAEDSGPLQVLEEEDPVLTYQKEIHGIRWPMIANAGTSFVYEPQDGKASYYHEGQRLATGERFDPSQMTAAHKTLPFGTLVRCTCKATGASVIVMINDRGPYVRGRIIDLSREAARRLGMLRKGVIAVRLDILAYPAIEAMGPKGNG